MFNRGIPDHVVKTTLGHMRSDVSKLVGNIRAEFFCAVLIAETSKSQLVTLLESRL